MYSIDDDFNRISICEAKEELVDGKGMIHLKRIADVDENGEIQNVNSLKNHQPKQMLVPREQYGPFARIGVWDWKAMSNKRSILFKAKYRPDIKITFVNVLKNINSRQSIVSKIIDGNLPFIGKKVRDNNGNLIVLYKTLNDYKGYFINDNQLQEKKYRIKENVFELKKILISKNNLSKKIGDFGGYQLLRTVDFQPSNNEGGDLIKQTDKIIKPLLLEYLNQLLKQPKLLSATDASYLEHLVHKLTQQEFVQLVSDKMKVSQSGARQIFENFLQGADTYIEAKDLPSYAIYRMAQKSPKIQEIVWRGQNTSQVRLATQRLSKLNHEIESANVTKQTIEMEIETNKQQMNKLQEEVRHNQSLIKDVTVKTNGQLAKIHDDTTENLTNAPFIQYLDDGKKSDSHQYVSGLKAKDSIEIGSETELLKTIEGNLYNLGIKKIEELAKFFYVSLVGNISIMLIGPYSEELVDLLSMSIYDHHAAILDCVGEFDLNVLDKLEQSDDKLIIVRNILNSKWVNYIPKLVNLADKQVIFTHPFIEDLRIEPESLFNYMLPIFTELLIDDPEIVDLTFVGGNVASNFKKVEKEDIDVSSEFMQQNCSRRFIRAHMNKLLNLYHAYSTTRTRLDLDYLCCYTPYAYLTNKQDELKKSYRNQGNVSTEIKERLDEFLK